MNRSTLVLALAFAAASPGVADVSARNAQELHTSGFVMDRDGKPVVNAVIVAENPSASPPTFSTTTDRQGVYSLAGIKPGSWKLTVSMTGFSSESSDIVVEDSGNIPSNLNFFLTRRPAHTAVGPGIRPLTPESLKEALSMDRDDVPKVSAPLVVKLVAAEADSSLIDRALRLATDAPFNVDLLTPFARAALAAGEARRTFAPPPKVDVAALNKQGLVVSVTPGTSFVTADAVKTVVIRRGEAIIKPLTSVVTPTTIENRMGAKKRSATGRFTFPMSTFAPTGALTIVIVGQLHNFEIPMSQLELGMLR